MYWSGDAAWHVHGHITQQIVRPVLVMPFSIRGTELMFTIPGIAMKML